MYIVLGKTFNYYVGLCVKLVASNLFQAESSIRPVTKSGSESETEATNQTVVNTGGNDAPEISKDNNTLGDTETVIKQEDHQEESSKADDDSNAATSSENKPEKVAEQIKRSTKKKGKKEKRQSGGKKAAENKATDEKESVYDWGMNKLEISANDDN